MAAYEAEKAYQQLQVQHANKDRAATIPPSLAYESRQNVDLNGMTISVGPRPPVSASNPSIEEIGSPAKKAQIQIPLSAVGNTNIVDDIPTVGDIAPEPSKSLTVKLPAKRAIKPEGSNLGRNATLASGLPSYTGTYSIGNYQGLDLSRLPRHPGSVVPYLHPAQRSSHGINRLISLQNHGHYSQTDHAHSNSGYLSAGYGGMDGHLPMWILHNSRSKGKEQISSRSGEVTQCQTAGEESHQAGGFQLG